MNWIMIDIMLNWIHLSHGLLGILTISTDYLDSLSWMANRYKNDDTIIAYDLKNEPHGAAGESTRAIWNDSKDSNNWKHVAEKAALAVLSKNPNALVLVEGIQIYPKNIKNNKNYSSMNEADYHNTWWGGNLRGVKDFLLT